MNKPHVVFLQGSLAARPRGATLLYNKALGGTLVRPRGRAAAAPECRREDWSLGLCSRAPSARDEREGQGGERGERAVRVESAPAQGHSPEARSAAREAFRREREDGPRAFKRPLPNDSQTRTPTPTVADKRTMLMHAVGQSKPRTNVSALFDGGRVLPKSTPGAEEGRTKDGERVARAVEVVAGARQPERRELVRKVGDPGEQDGEAEREQPADLALDGEDARRDLRRREGGRQEARQHGLQSARVEGDTTGARTTMRLKGTAATVRANSAVPPPPLRSRNDVGTRMRNCGGGRGQATSARRYKRRLRSVVERTNLHREADEEEPAKLEQGDEDLERAVPAALLLVASERLEHLPAELLPQGPAEADELRMRREAKGVSAGEPARQGHGRGQEGEARRTTTSATPMTTGTTTSRIRTTR